MSSFNTPRDDDLFLGSNQGLHSYGDLNQFQDFFLQFLFDFDHNFEKPVGFLSESSDSLIFGIAACWRLGIPFVCFSDKASSSELQQQVEMIDPGLIFVDDERNNMIDHPNKIDIYQLNLERALNIETKLSYQAKNFDASTEPQEIFGYFFTSGTSGKPKIVPLKRRQMIVAAHSSAENFRPRMNHFWLLCLPLNHIGGISIILRSLLYGSGIFRMKSFKPDRVIKFLSENKLFHAASLVPTMLKKLIEQKGFYTHNQFKAILLGGGPIDPELVKACNRRGIPLVPSYGMTETCAQIAANPILKPSGTYSPMRSVGKVFHGNEIEIRDDSNNVLGLNTSGTIWLRGPQVFDGYLNEDEHDSEEIDYAGWFNTGDYGYVNNRGQLFIKSRRSDLIITGGENVSPFEVESTLTSLDEISEAAVIGLNDEKWGEKVAAVVVPDIELSISSQEIQDKLKSRISSFKIPKTIVQSDSLPRTQTGKLQRSKLKRLFTS
ncbi:2-succinylbenzoyl-CoA synthetase [Fodinibius salinus]|uniref:2-succinylbenzoyl-CoA synthetase n=1 Tax=Fodinibius salinus TaxID=860790 RepID=A0A5D3YQN1_9BACT|nr:AMP-binding protein [Fodinibius salinus]TYP95293.1 2-succinylbenzoyl-CoA synthetase [Fodinibius salinus]